MTTPAISTAADTAQFGPSNPFYNSSKLPFQAPPFDKIKDEDYQPALEAGMAEQLKEVEAIANDPAQPTFENSIVALEKSGQLFTRVYNVFSSVTQANSDPKLLEVRSAIAPKYAAQKDAIYLNAKLFQRVATLYKQRDTLKLDPESQRLLTYYYDKFVHAGANLSEEDKTKLKKLNEELAALADTFSNKLLAATKESAFVTQDKTALTGLSDAEVAAAAEAAKGRNLSGYVIPLKNTTMQPDFVSLTNRATRQTIFENSWDRAERGGANDTRDTIAKLAQLRAQKAQLLGFPNYASWKLEDQMARTPDAALRFMNALVPPATARASAEAKDIQALIDQQKGGFQLQPWDWDFYSEQVRKAKYDIDEEQVKPYFEINNVLENGVFYAANQLYGLTFKERKDIPTYTADMRVFEVFNDDGSTLALFYTDYFKRDNKEGGAWMGGFVDQSTLLGTKPVVFNVCNFAKPVPGEPALVTSDDVTTMFHEFGHALHGMFSNTKYRSLSGTTEANDFAEFPSQFNEHWATYPSVFQHFARHYKTAAPMPVELLDKIKKAHTFNAGYDITHVVAAAELDMQWHTLPPSAPLQQPDTFEKAALEKLKLWIPYVPPRYRSSYFRHIWSDDYSAGYYAYLWTMMLDDDAYQWFVDNGGLTRANGDRFRKMVLSQGSTQDLETLYENWRGGKPTIGPMLKYRGLEPEGSPK
jgi:peptidyl-dipeptidase Dcp